MRTFPQSFEKIGLSLEERLTIPKSIFSNVERGKCFIFSAVFFKLWFTTHKQGTKQYRVPDQEVFRVNRIEEKRSDYMVGSTG